MKINTERLFIQLINGLVTYKIHNQLNAYTVSINHYLNIASCVNILILSY